MTLRQTPWPSSLQAAADACAAKGGYLPTPMALYSTRGVINLGTGTGTDHTYTDSYYGNTTGGSYRTIVIDGTGALSEQEPKRRRALRLRLPAGALGDGREVTEGQQGALRPAAGNPAGAGGPKRPGPSRDRQKRRRHRRLSRRHLPAKAAPHGNGPDRGADGGQDQKHRPNDPPVLQRIILQINSHGVLQSKGLARCSLAKLELGQLHPSQEGMRGGPDRPRQRHLQGDPARPGRLCLSNGPLLAFNGTHKGKPAIFAQVATGAPLPLTYVIVFEVAKTKGTFGTQLTATLPPIASEYGYISAFDMSLQRRYSSNGKQLSYASAGCPAPQGANIASFSLAKASYQFLGGRSLTQTLVRQCKVRGK